jgi:hypothetical protein
MDLRRILNIEKPAVRARYELRELEPGVIEEAVSRVSEPQPAT